MNRSLYYLMFIVLLLVIMQDTATSQYFLEFAYPANGASFVPIDPEIRIRSNYHIDASSILWVPDSLDGERRRAETVYLLPKYIYDSFEKTDWWKYTYQGDYSISSDSILVFKPKTLAYDQEYVIIVKGVRVLDPGGTSHNTPDATIAFRTVETVPEVVSISCSYGKEIFPQDTITVSFCSPLYEVSNINGNVATAAGNLIQFYQITDYDFDYRKSWMTPVKQSVSSHSWLSTDRKTIYATMTGTSTTSNPELLMEVHTSYVTGDTLDDKPVPFRFAQAYLLLISAGTIDGNQQIPDEAILSPGIGDFQIQYNDLVEVRAVSTLKGYKFLKWECPDYSRINNVQDSEIRFRVSKLDNVRQTLRIKALYQCSADSFYVNIADNGKTLLFDAMHGNTLGGNGKYALIEDQYKAAIALPDSGYVFTHWSSDNPSYDGSTSALAIITGNMQLDFLEPHFDLKNSNPVFGLCSKVSAVDNQDISHLVLLFPSPTGCVKERGDQQQAMVGADIIGPNYTPYRFISCIKPDGTIINYSTPQTSVRETMDTWDPPRDCIFIAAIPLYSFSVEKELLDNPNSNGDFYGVKVQIKKSTDWVDLPYKLKTNVLKLIYEVPCGSQIRCIITDDTQRSIFFMEWEGYPYESPINNSDRTHEFYVAHDNMQLKAIFETPFRLENIVFKTMDNTTGIIAWREYSTYGYQTVNNVQIDELVPGGTTVKVKLVFSKPVDEATIVNSLAGGGWITSFFATDYSERIDSYYKWKWNHGLDHPKFFYIPKAIDFSNYTLSPDKRTIEFSIMMTSMYSYNEYVKIPKMEEFALCFISGQYSIKSTLGEALSNPGTYYAMTEMPNIRYELKSIDIDYDHDWWWKGKGEMFHIINIVRNREDDPEKPTKREFYDKKDVKIPGDSSCYQIDSHTHNIYDYTLHTFIPLRLDDAVELSLMTYEDDGGELVTSVGKFFSQLGDSVIKHFPITKDFNETTWIGIGGIASVALGNFLKSIGSDDEELVGHVEFKPLTKDNWWGADTYNPLFVKPKTDQDARFTIDAYLE